MDSVSGFFTLNRVLGAPNGRLPYPSLMVTLLFLGGVQLMSLGIISGYLERVFDETKRRPLYMVNSFDAPKNTTTEGKIASESWREPKGLDSQPVYTRRIALQRLLLTV